MRPRSLTYVLVTPARNEAEFIELTIKSVIDQTVRPLRWIIVSDGSTDGTDDIVKRYAVHHPWIELFRMPENPERTFASKAHALNAGYKRVRDLSYEATGTLDADISFGPDYFAFLLEKLRANPRLGLVGTPFTERSRRTYDYRIVSIEHVSGACQFFRRECFEQIGGYTPLPGGGVDHIMVITARMRGWETRTFLERECVHHRIMGTAQHGLLRARFNNGQKDYAFGNHPLWELFRSVYQMANPPLIAGGAAVLMGYVWSAIRGAKRPVSADLVAFTRAEQRRRLVALVKAPWWNKRPLPAAMPMASASPQESSACVPPSSSSAAATSK